jgi:energy-coupling factor transporter ATP-binding protein EcfA2
VHFVVDLVAITFTRELGALITAIAVSGRTASAISAEVGTMVVTEEIDALRVMGLDPVEFTLAPRYLGALITIPCLTVLSTLCGVLAGYLFLWSSIGMSLRVYVREVAESILLRDVWLTLIKSAIFATIIVHVGYMEGLQARGGPEAVGTATTVGGGEIHVSRHRRGPRGDGHVLPDGMERSRMSALTASASQAGDLHQGTVRELRRPPHPARRRPRHASRRDLRAPRRQRIGQDDVAETRAGAREAGGRDDLVNDTDITSCSASELAAVRRRIGVAFQGSALFNSMTIADNVALPLRELTQLAEPIIALMVWLKLKAVGLANESEFFPHQLSGGMKKRAAWRGPWPWIPTFSCSTSPPQGSTRSSRRGSTN